MTNRPPTNWKKLTICEYDNLNQSKQLKGQIDIMTYRYNKQIIHGLYDNMDKYTLTQIIIKLKYDTKELN